MNGLEVGMEQLRQPVVALVGKKAVGCTSGSDGGGTVDNEVMREMLRKSHLILAGG